MLGPHGENQVRTESTGGAVVGACHRDSERPCGRIARQGVGPQAGFTGSGKWVLTQQRPSVELGGRGGRTVKFIAPAKGMNCFSHGC